MKEKVIEIKDYSFKINQKEILKNVSLDVYNSEYLSIIGPNGAGKTTLLKCLDKIYHGGSGNISVKGKPLTKYSQKDLAKCMGYVPQMEGRSMPYTVKEFVMMGRYPHLSPFTFTGKSDEDIVDAALSLIGVKNLTNRVMSTLSGGEKQKILIAAALTQEASILLLDEPTTFLDPKHLEDIQARIRRINREWGVTIISVTHDINHALLSSDRFLALKNGEVAFCGNADELMSKNILEYIYDTTFTYVKHPDTGQPIIVPKALK